MPIILKLISTFNTISIRILADFFTEIGKLFLKFIRNCKGPRITKIILKEHSWKTQTNVYSNIIYNIPKIETTQKAINWWMDEQNVIYPYNGNYSTIKRRVILIRVTTELNLENIKWKKSQKTTYYITPIIEKCQE